MFTFCIKINIMIEWHFTCICSLLALGICLNTVLQFIEIFWFHLRIKMKALMIPLFILTFYHFGMYKLFNRCNQIFIYFQIQFDFWTNIIAVKYLIELYKTVKLHIKTFLHICIYVYIGLGNWSSILYELPRRISSNALDVMWEKNYAVKHFICSLFSILYTDEF